MQAQQPAGHTVRRHQRRERHGHDRHQGDDGKHLVREMAQIQPGQPEHKRVFARLGEQQAAHDGRARGEAGPFGDHRHERRREQHHQQRQDQRLQQGVTVRHQHQRPQRGEKDRLEEIGERRQQTPQHAADGKTGEREPGEKRADNKRQAEQVRQTREDKQHRHAADEQGFLVDSTAHDERLCHVALQTHREQGQAGRGQKSAQDEDQPAVAAGQRNNGHDHQHVLQQQHAQHRAAKGFEDLPCAAKLLQTDQRRAGRDRQRHVHRHQRFMAQQQRKVIPERPRHEELQRADPQHRPAMLPETAGIQLDARGKHQKSDA